MAIEMVEAEGERPAGLVSARCQRGSGRPAQLACTRRPGLPRPTLSSASPAPQLRGVLDDQASYSPQLYNVVHHVR